MQSAQLVLTRVTASRLSLGACLLVAVAMSLAYSWHYLPEVMDDALISYRYSERLLNGHGLTWNDGEFVEGYSNLFWVLIIAAGGLVQSDLILVGWVVGLIANICVLVALVWTFGQSPGASLFSVISGLIMLSLSGAFAFWGVSGMETSLVGALLAWALATTHRMRSDTWSWICPALLLAFLSITRPDGILFAASIAIALVVRDGFNRASIQLAARLLSLPFAFFFAQIAFRLVYYGALVPNTAYAKLAFTVDRVLLGSLYLTKGALVNSVPLLVMLAVALLLWRSQRWQVLRGALLFLVPGFAWLAYVAVVGGDFFPFQRHWQPALVCFAFALSSLVGGLLHVALGRFVTLATAAAALYVVSQNSIAVELELGQELRLETVLSNIKKALSSYTENSRGQDGHWYTQCKASGQFLRTAFGSQRPLLAVYRAGCLPYTTQLPSLDMLGLTDSYIAHHRPPSMGKGIIAHELGDGAYVLSRKPDLIEYVDESVDCLSSESWCRTQREMVDKPEFRHLYRLVVYRVENDDIPLWTRIEDGRIGIVRSANAIYIPGFLLATTSAARAVLDEGRMLVAQLENGDAAVEDVHIPAGTWEVSLIADALSNLQLATSPAADAVVLRPNSLRIVSDGTPRSFRVFGQHGKIHAITARALN